MQYTPSKRKTAHRRKTPPYIYTNERLMELFMRLIDAPNFRDRMYVYRIVNGKPVKPALFSGEPFSWIENYLQEEHKGGEFLIMIRRGEKMMLTGSIAIEPLPANWKR